MANARGKSIDNTHLSLELAMDHGFSHRDYIAHVFRWSYVIRRMHQNNRFKTDHVLDVGCGREMPLARAMFSMMMTHTTGSYTGCDYNKLKPKNLVWSVNGQSNLEWNDLGPDELVWPHSIPKKGTKWHMKLVQDQDFLEAELTRKSYDTIVSFEMLEHIEPVHAFKILRKMRRLLAKTGNAFISTPCYDAHVGAADNHVGEHSFQSFRAMLLMAGFQIDDVHGTFASQKDYKKLLTPGQLEVFEALNEYYDPNIISNIFAPMFPEQSRNAIWSLSAGKVVMPSREEIRELAKPQHNSSTHWSADFKKILKLAQG